MDMRQLKALVRIAETGSFSEAARRLNVTQPALSRQIRLLEESLGERLLLRTGRGAVPTEAGHLLLARADLILGEVEKARQAIASRQDAVTGRVAFGLPPSVGVRLTGPVVARYRARHPQVGLAIVEELSGEVQQGLLTGTLDLGLLYAGTVSPSLRSEPLLAERLHVLAPPGGAILSGRPVPFHDL
ncbi:MAG: LysR family transcriptional regulator, partial [Alphaproteobacteria bacterium]|nr:LysR family transcriptional regulator [Alphaproteobacteria bacterium]